MYQGRSIVPPRVVSRLDTKDILAPKDGDDPGLGPVPRELVIASMLRPGAGTGVQTHVRELRNYLESRDIQSNLVTPFSWGKRLAWPVFGARYLIEPFHDGASVAWYRTWHGAFLQQALRKTLRDLDDVIIYAQCPVAAKAALNARRHDHQLVIMAVHFDTSQADEWAIWKGIARHGRTFEAIRHLESEVLPRLDGIVFVSQSGQRALSWVHGLENVPATIVPNFIQSEAPAGSVQRTGDLVNIGALDARKNQGYLLEVLASANRLNSRYTLDLIGAGQDERALRRQAKLLGVDGQVRFLGFRSNAKALLPQYGAYVHAAKLEVLPLAIIEAMAAGLPAVAGAVGGIPELFDPSLEGRFWPLDDPDAAARVLISLMSDESARSMAGAAARRRFEGSYATEVAAPQLLEFLASQLHAGRSAPRPTAHHQKSANGRRHKRQGGENDTTPTTTQDGPAEWDHFPEVQYFQEVGHGEGHDYSRGSPHHMHAQLTAKVISSLGSALPLAAEGRPLEVLEVGAGHGAYTDVLRSLGARVTVTEMSKPSVDRLSRRFAHDPNVDVMYDPDGTWAMLTDETFDAVVCLSVLHHIPDYLAAVRRYSEITRVGGVFVSWQDPIQYDRVPAYQRRAALISYYLWRLTQGKWLHGFATVLRRLRGVLDETKIADMVEYHVVRDGVDEKALEALLSSHYDYVTVERYWSTQGSHFQSWGERHGFESTFGVIAQGRH